MLVNTHHHGDHTFGNWLMPADTPIVGHVLCREDVLAAGLIASAVLTGPDYGHQEVRPPDVTFTGSMTLYLGERRGGRPFPGAAPNPRGAAGWGPGGEGGLPRGGAPARRPPLLCPRRPARYPA